MSNGQENHNNPIENENGNEVGHLPQVADDIGNLERLVDAAVMLPLARASLLDYLYAYGIPVMNVGAYADERDHRDLDQMASIISRSLYDSRPVKHVMPEEKEKEIKETTFNQEQAEKMKINTTCGIWQEDFVEGEAIKILPCNHAFKADAITKWLTTEKAECPVCRYALESKEVIDRPLQAGNEFRESDDRERDGVANRNNNNVPRQFDEQHARFNNIMYRQNNMIQGRASGGGAVADPARSVYAAAHASRESIAMPINQLIQNRRYMIENIARASGAVGVHRRWISGAPVAQPAAAEPVRAAPPQAQGSANPPHHNSVNNEAHAEPGDHGDNIYNINNIINIYNNNHNFRNDDVVNNLGIPIQEQADIDEAIRRSLMDN
jgi:hypothetical protein